MNFETLENKKVYLSMIGEIIADMTESDADKIMFLDTLWSHKRDKGARAKMLYILRKYGLCAFDWDLWKQEASTPRAAWN